MPLKFLSNINSVCFELKPTVNTFGSATENTTTISEADLEAQSARIHVHDLWRNKINILPGAVLNKQSEEWAANKRIGHDDATLENELTGSCGMMNQLTRTLIERSSISSEHNVWQ